MRSRADAVPACASFLVRRRPPSQARQKWRQARRLPAAGGSPERAPPCRGAVGVGVRPVATRSTSMCGVHEVICKGAAAPGCILWFPHLRTEAPNRCTFCSETRRRGPGRARLAPGPTRPAVTQPYALTLGGVRGVKCHALLTGLKIKCEVRAASKSRSKSKSMQHGMQFNFLPSCWKTVLQGFILPDFKSDGQPEFGVDRAQRLSLVCSSTPPSEAASLRPGASPRVKLGGLNPRLCSCVRAAYPPLCRAGSI